MINLITSVRPAVECPVGEDTGKIMSNQTGRKKRAAYVCVEGKKKASGFCFSLRYSIKRFSLHNTEQTPSCKQTQKENFKSDRT